MSAVSEWKSRLPARLLAIDGRETSRGRQPAIRSTLVGQVISVDVE